MPPSPRSVRGFSSRNATRVSASCEPVRVETPTLLLSGTHDPVTPPRFGEEAAKHLPNGLHVVVPGAHGVGGPQVDAMIRKLLDRGSVEGIDVSATKRMRLPPLYAPRMKRQKV